MSTRHSFLSTTGLIRSSSSASNASFAPSVRASPRSTKTSPDPEPRSKNIKKLKLGGGVESVKTKLRGSAGVIPLGPTFLVGIAVVMSLFFIGALSFAFIGAEDEPVFQRTLNGLAQENPGIVLIGDNVDVDVDEPSVTLRWSILACGSTYVLPGSEGTHGSSTCGIPNVPLSIFVDSEEKPAATYDPSGLPITSATSKRLGIQNLYQFDSDHVLDVHEARLYPFDTYRLTTTLRAVVTNTSTTVPITRLLTITDTASFLVAPSDAASFVQTDDEQLPSRDLDMAIQRPGEARFFTLMLFGVNWMLAHACVAYVALAWKSEGSDRVLRYLAFCLVTLLVIPRIRDIMPDAPGYDGVLIDQIGLFAQTLLAGIATLTLLCTLAKRELIHFSESAPVEEFVKEKPAPISRGLHKMRGSSTSVDFRHFRSFSRPFVAKVEPPTPIMERPDQSPYLDPFAAPSRAQRGTASTSVYSEWV